MIDKGPKGIRKNGNGGGKTNLFILKINVESFIFVFPVERFPWLLPIAIRNLIYLSLEALVVRYEGLKICTTLPLLSVVNSFGTNHCKNILPVIHPFSTVANFGKLYYLLVPKKMANIYHHCGTSTTKQHYFP